MKKINIYILLIWIFTFALASWAAIRLIIHASAYLSYPLPVDDGEGHVLNQAVIISKGSLPYFPVSESPWIVSNYPPVFAFLSSLLFPFFKSYSLSADVTVFPGLIATRLISVISGIGICFLIGKISRISGGKFSLSILAGILFMAMPMVYFWFAIGKPDMLALALALLGFYIGLANLEKGNRLFLAVIPLVAAIFTRQSEIAAFAALAVFLFLKRDNRAVRFIIIYAVSIVVIAVLFQLITNGEFLRHIIIYTKTQSDPNRLLNTWKHFFTRFSIVFVLVLFTMIRRFLKGKISAIELYFFFAACVALTSGKVGSDMNYFLEAIATGLAILAFYASTDFSISAGTKTGFAVAGLIFLVALDFAFIHDDRYLSYVPIKTDINSDTLGDMEVGDILIGIIKKQKKVLSEDEAFCVISGKEVYFNPFIMTELSKEGLWDQSDFVKSIEDKEYDMIILRFDVNSPNHGDKPDKNNAGWDRWTEQMEEAIRRNYRNFAVFPLRRQWYVYYPLTEENLKRFNS